jgi:ABC-type lipoprotein export system ATPase subunit/ABC-type lipoprotein release transport system permease subunit
MDMIDLKLLQKVYTDSGLPTIALHDITLSLPSKGLVFITGKSGSGKSTLLNLLAGIDTSDSGDILFNSENMSQYNEKQLNFYRNHYVGLIFQEFNLIDKLSVRDNVSLGMPTTKEHKETHEKKIDALLDLMDISHLKSSLASHISGGEKQRTGIARGLIKDPFMILADEPTGNLDSENTDRTLQLFKTISKDRLVVVVTHDTENALLYGDRVIELRDGSVVSDTFTETEIFTEISNKPHFPTNKGKSETIRLDIILMFMRSFLSKRRFRQVISVVMITVALFLINMGLVYYMYDFNKATINVFKDSEIEQIALYKYNDNEDKEYFYSFTIDEIENLKKDYPIIHFDVMYSNPIQATGVYNSLLSPIKISTDSIYDSMSFSNIIMVDESSQYDILYGNLPIQDGEIVISDYMANMIIKYQYYDDVSTIDTLVGQELIEGKKELTISGIINTDYESYYDVNKNQETMYKTGFYINQNLYYKAIYTTPSTYDTILHSTGKLKLLTAQEYKNILIGSNYDETMGPLIGNVPTEDNEIMISLSVLERYMNEVIIAGDITGNTNEISAYLNKQISLDLTYYDMGITEYTVSGIIDDFNTGNSIPLFFSQDLLNHFDYENKDSGYMIGLTASVNGNYESIVTIVNEQDVRYMTRFSPELYSMSDIVIHTVPMIEVIGILIIVIALLIMTSYISYTIVSSIKEIGIIRSLGLSKIEVSKVYVLQNLFIVLIAFIISTILVIVSITIQNKEISRAWELSTGILYFDYLTFVITIIIAILISFIASIIPVVKINKLPPISVIRNS